MFKMRVTGNRTYKINVTTEVAQLCSANPKRIGLLVYNNGSGVVYVLSHQNMKAGDGMPIQAGASYNDEQSTNEKFIVAGSSTRDVRVEVISE